MMNIFANEKIDKVFYWQIHFSVVYQHLGPVPNINFDSYIRTATEFHGQLIVPNSLSPSINTQATGTAKFSIDPDGNMAYQIKNRNDLAWVFNSYMEVNWKSQIPTGEENGQLSKGIITTNDLSGPLIGKTVTDLTNLMKNDSVYVVRTQAHENGELQGLVIPSNAGYTQTSGFSGR